jgi:hypothetical protein
MRAADGCNARLVRFPLWDSCPGRGAAFFMPLRRAGTVPDTGVRYGPGSAAHRFAKSYALRCVRGTKLLSNDRSENYFGLSAAAFLHSDMNFLRSLP